MRAAVSSRRRCSELLKSESRSLVEDEHSASVPLVGAVDVVLDALQVFDLHEELLETEVHDALEHGVDVRREMPLVVQVLRDVLGAARDILWGKRVEVRRCEHFVAVHDEEHDGDDLVHALLVRDARVFLRPEEQHRDHLLAHLASLEERKLLVGSIHVLRDYFAQVSRLEELGPWVVLRVAGEHACVQRCAVTFVLKASGL